MITFFILRQIVQIKCQSQFIKLISLNKRWLSDFRHELSTPFVNKEEKKNTRIKNFTVSSTRLQFWEYYHKFLSKLDQ